MGHNHQLLACWEGCLGLSTVCSWATGYDKIDHGHTSPYLDGQCMKSPLSDLILHSIGLRRLTWVLHPDLSGGLRTARAAGHRSGHATEAANLCAINTRVALQSTLGTEPRPSTQTPSGSLPSTHPLF